MNREIRDAIALLGAGRERLPGYDQAPTAQDARCDLFGQRVVGLRPGGILALTSELAVRQRQLVYRCSVRAASQAIAFRSPDLTRRALALALAASSTDQDPRDLMISLAPHHVAAVAVTGTAAPLFDWAADRCSAGHEEIVRHFGTRTDVTLEGFGWTRTTGGSGTWIVPAGWTGRGRADRRPGGLTPA